MSLRKLKYLNKEGVLTEGAFRDVPWKRLTKGDIVYVRYTMGKVDGKDFDVALGPMVVVDKDKYMLAFPDTPTEECWVPVVSVLILKDKE